MADIGEGVPLAASLPAYAEVVLPVEPEVIVEDRSGGLQEVIENALRDKPGKISVLVESLDGTNLSAGVGIHEEFNPYSTYKLFVALLVLEKIDTLEWYFTDTVSASKDVRACLEDMIIKSDNECPETFFEMLGGRAAIEKAVQAHGYEETYFVGDLRSTVSDQILFLRRLYRGELLTVPSTEYLIDLMKKQKFRDGIASGVDDPVANKVGFLFDYLHDSGIVYGDNVTYAISIYTKANSWSDIAEISSKIHAYIDN